MAQTYTLLVVSFLALTASARKWDIECPKGTWDGVLDFDFKTVYQPATAEEVASVVRAALSHDPPRKVKAVGGGFSHDAIAAPEDILLCTNNLDDIIAKTNDTITVGAGMHTGTLMDIMAVEGKYIKGFLQVPDFRIGGVLSAGIGPIGKEKALYESVTELVIVDGTGTIRTLSPSQDAPAFDAVRGGVGVAGIIVQATFRWQKNFRSTKKLIAFESIDDALAKCGDIATASDAWEFWWTPAEECVRAGDAACQGGTLNALGQGNTTAFIWGRDDSDSTPWGKQLWKFTDAWPRVETLPVVERSGAECGSYHNRFDWESPTALCPCHTEFSIRFPQQYLRKVLSELLQQYEMPGSDLPVPATVLFWCPPTGSSGEQSFAKFDAFLRPEDAAGKAAYKRFYDSLRLPDLTYYAPKELFMTPEQCPDFKVRARLDPHEIFLNNFTAVCGSSPPALTAESN